MASAAHEAVISTAKVPEEEENLVKEVSRFVNDDRIRGVSDDQEKLAHKVASAPEHVVRAVVKTLLDLINVNASSTYILELFAWLLLYDAIDPLQILQLVVRNRDSTFLEICGTRKFADDVIKHLGLQKSEGRKPRFPIPKTVVNPVLVDILHHERPRKAVTHETYRPSATMPQLQRPLPQPYEESVQSTVEPKATRLNLEEYAVRIRKAVKSSMTAEEASHKILKIYTKNTESIVASILFDICCEQKIYDRIHGNLATRIQRTNNRLWAPAWSKLMSKVFNDTCESLDADRLKVAGSYFGHVLTSGELNWADTLGAISLDSKQSTPSNRIFFLAFLKQIRQEVGVSPIEGQIMTPVFEEKASSILSTDLAPGFWDLAGFHSIAEHCKKLAENSTDKQQT